MTTQVRSNHDNKWSNSTAIILERAFLQSEDALSEACEACDSIVRASSSLRYVSELVMARCIPLLLALAQKWHRAPRTPVSSDPVRDAAATEEDEDDLSECATAALESLICTGRVWAAKLRVKGHNKVNEQSARAITLLNGLDKLDWKFGSVETTTQSRLAEPRERTVLRIVYVSPLEFRSGFTVVEFRSASATARRALFSTPFLDFAESEIKVSDCHDFSLAYSSPCVSWHARVFEQVALLVKGQAASRSASSAIDCSGVVPTLSPSVLRILLLGLGGGAVATALEHQNAKALREYSGAANTALQSPPPLTLFEITALERDVEMLEAAAAFGLHFNVADSSNSTDSNTNNISCYRSSSSSSSNTLLRDSNTHHGTDERNQAPCRVIVTDAISHLFGGRKLNQSAPAAAEQESACAFERRNSAGLADVILVDMYSQGNPASFAPGGGFGKDKGKDLVHGLMLFLAREWISFAPSLRRKTQKGCFSSKVPPEEQEAEKTFLTDTALSANKRPDATVATHFGSIQSNNPRFCWIGINCPDSNSGRALVALFRSFATENENKRQFCSKDVDHAQTFHGGGASVHFGRVAMVAPPSPSSSHSLPSFAESNAIVVVLAAVGGDDGEGGMHEHEIMRKGKRVKQVGRDVEDTEEGLNDSHLCRETSSSASLSAHANSDFSVLLDALAKHNQVLEDTHLE